MQPNLAIIISCVGRKLVMKGETEEEIEAVKNTVPVMKNKELLPSDKTEDLEFKEEKFFPPTLSQLNSEHEYKVSKGFLENKKILVVDDDIRNTIVLTKLLKSQNAIVIAAANGKIAIEELLKDKTIDLVLMDVMMPIMDGYNTITEIKKISQLKNLIVIAVTAKAMSDDRQKCLEMGFDEYISKPIDKVILFKMLKTYLKVIS